MYKNLTIVALIGLFFAGQASADSHTDPDFNDDGIVNLADYDLFVSHWGTQEGGDNWDAKFDLDGDGVIALGDYDIFVSNWGKTFPVSPSGGGGGSSSPDLIVESPSVSNSTLTTGQSFTLSATVRNQGTGASASTTLRYYRSSGTTISPSDTEVGTDAVGSLNASGTSAESISLNAPSNAGTYYYGACVENVSDESDTNNNCSSAVRVTVSQTTSGFAPADQQAFNSLVVGKRILAGTYFFDFESAGRFTESFGRNQGSYTYSNTGANTSTLTLNYDGELRCTIQLTFTSTTTGTISTTCNDRVIFEDLRWQLSDLTTPLFARANADTLVFRFLDTWSARQTRAYDVQIRKKMPQGDWAEFCRVKSNELGRSVTTYLPVTISGTEPNTTYEMRYRYRNSSSCNTGSPGPWSAIAEGTTPGSGSGSGSGGGGSGPDDSLEPPRSAFPGLRVRSDGKFTHTNFTLFGIPIWVGCAKEVNWFHPYTVVSSRWQKQEGTSWVDIPGTRLVGEICGYQTDVPGTYRLVVVMNRGRQFFSENTFTVTAGSSGSGGGSSGSGGGSSGSPDLVIDSLSVSDSSPGVEEYFTLNVTVRNQGNGSGTYSFTTLRYYQSADATISTSDTEVGWNHVTRLDPSETSEESARVRAPSSPGTYYYGACIESVTGESNTNNNCSSSITVTVSGSDLIVESPAVSDSSPGLGESFTLSATVRNQGGSRSASTTLRYYLSTDQTITTDDTEVDTDYVHRLAPSETSEESARVRAPSSASTYYYGACVEAVTGESDTGNNCSTGVRVTVQ